MRVRRLLCRLVVKFCLLLGGCWLSSMAVNIPVWPPAFLSISWFCFISISTPCCICFLDGGKMRRQTSWGAGHSVHSVDITASRERHLKKSVEGMDKKGGKEGEKKEKQEQVRRQKCQRTPAVSKGEAAPPDGGTIPGPSRRCSEIPYLFWPCLAFFRPPHTNDTANLGHDSMLCELCPGHCPGLVNFPNLANIHTDQSTQKGHSILARVSLDSVLRKILGFFLGPCPSLFIPSFPYPVHSFFFFSSSSASLVSSISHPPGGA